MSQVLGVRVLGGWVRCGVMESGFGGKGFVRW